MKTNRSESGHLKVANPAAAKPAASLPEGISAGINSLKELQASMPWPAPLMAPERKQFRKIGPQMLRSLQNCLTAARQHGEALPVAFDRTAFEADVELTLAVAEYLALLDEMTLRARDLLLVCGTRASHGAAEVQGHLRAVSNRVSGLQHATERLSVRTGRPKRKEKTASIDAAAPAVPAPVVETPLDKPAASTNEPEQPKAA